VEHAIGPTSASALQINLLLLLQFVKKKQSVIASRLQVERRLTYLAAEAAGDDNVAVTSGNHVWQDTLGQ